MKLKTARRFLNRNSWKLSRRRIDKVKGSLERHEKKTIKALSKGGPK